MTRNRRKITEEEDESAAVATDVENASENDEDQMAEVVEDQKTAEDQETALE